MLLLFVSAQCGLRNDCVLILLAKCALASASGFSSAVWSLLAKVVSKLLSGL